MSEQLKQELEADTDRLETETFAELCQGLVGLSGLV